MREDRRPQVHRRLLQEVRKGARRRASAPSATRSVTRTARTPLPRRMPSPARHQAGCRRSARGDGDAGSNEGGGSGAGSGGKSDGFTPSDSVAGAKCVANCPGETQRCFLSCAASALAAKIFGEPHVRTLDGTSYGLQSVGEFTYAASDGWTTQVRLTPWGDSGLVSVVGAAATRFGDDVITFDVDADPNRTGAPQRRTPRAGTEWRRGHDRRTPSTLVAGPHPDRRRRRRDGERRLRGRPPRPRDRVRGRHPAIRGSGRRRGRGPVERPAHRTRRGGLHEPGGA